jgi:hypothetical protein
MSSDHGQLTKPAELKWPERLVSDCGYDIPGALLALPHRILRRWWTDPAPCHIGYQGRIAKRPQVLTALNPEVLVYQNTAPLLREGHVGD